MKPLVCRFALFIALGLFVSPAGAGKIVEKAVDTPRPLTPAESATHFQVPEDLRLELVASEPLVT